MDIRQTLASVCNRVVYDHSVDEATRLKRCKGLKVLGEILLAHGGSTAAGINDMKKRLHQQMQQKEDGKEEAPTSEEKPSSESSTSK